MAANPPALITVVTGPEPVLVDREVDAAVDRLKASLVDLDVVTLDCGRKASADDSSNTTLAQRLFQALSPSLFGDAPIVVVRGLEVADDEVQQVLKAAFVDPSGSPIVVAHSGAAKGRGVVNAAKKAIR